MLKPTDSTTSERTLDYRERMAQQAAQDFEKRQRDREQQTSEFNSPADRIKIWERIYQMMLPRGPNHPVLHIIAAKTGLSVEQIHAEQRSRLQAAGSAKS